MRGVKPGAFTFPRSVSVRGADQSVPFHEPAVMQKYSAPLG